MTRTLEFPPELESRLQVLAEESGTSVEAFVMQELAARVLSEDELDAMLDARDAAAWEREKVNYDPSQNIKWEDFKAQLAADNAREDATMEQAA